MGFDIRDVPRDDLNAWWAVRLRALKEESSAFGSDYASSLANGPSRYEASYFDGGVNRLFSAYAADGSIAAITAVYGDSGKRAHLAFVISVYTVPEHRGQGLSTTLIDHAIRHVRAFPAILQLNISVNATNTAALRIYERAGFTPWGREPNALRTEDGALHDEIHMAMWLNRPDNA